VNRELSEKIHQKAADTFDEPLENIGPDSTPDTIAGWDSLTHLNFVLAIEQTFGVELEPEEGEKMAHGIRDALTVISKKLGR
jgi:acyl carrier protein